MSHNLHRAKQYLEQIIELSQQLADLQPTTESVSFAGMGAAIEDSAAASKHLVESRLKKLHLVKPIKYSYDKGTHSNRFS